MIKKYLIIISAVMALTGCVSDSFTGSEELERQANGELPISFGYDVPAATRAENTGADAATALGDQFIVYGEKNETAAAPASGSYVFPNYQVNYTTNTAYTTSSNTRDWEYVGFTHSTNYQNNITTKDGSSAAVTGYDAAQTIKFWDYSATSYTFTAVSASRTSGDPAQTDIERGYVKIQKNTSGATVYDKGYTITTTADADLTKLYLSDRLVINQSAGTDRDAKNAYGGNVTLTFRGGVAQIRVGIYETITGYDISEIKFYVNNTPEPPAAPTQTEEAKVETTSAFGALCPNVKAVGYAGTINVTYSDGSDPANPENRPVITPGESSGLNLILGTNTSTLTKDGETPKFLGTTSTAPTWDTADGAYTPVFPQPGNSTCLTLKCDYTLYNNRTKETIRLTGATTTIPAQYLQWKANYKYTYLFKITENTSGLYPITFDAVEVVEDGGKAEYITTISEPSITTYARGSDVLTNGDYKSGEKIYAVVEDEGSLATLSASNMKLYTVTAPDGKEIQHGVNFD